jgi:hypothetical protein
MQSILSRNKKTGASVNVWSCRPTPICKFFCYRFRRTKEDAQRILAEHGFDPGANNGPITWRVQTDFYRRVEARIKAAARLGELDDMAHRIARTMSFRDEFLRWCGTGDLFPELCELIALVAAKGVKSFGFSRKPAEMIYLATLLDDVGIPVGHPCRPFFIASTDASVDSSYGGGLVLGSRTINGEPATAYATWRTGEEAVQEVASRPWASTIKVVFGLHATSKKTRTEHPLACPSTEGGAIKCIECRRCYGGAL